MEAGTANPIEADMFSDLHTDTEVQTSAAITDPQTAVIRKLVHPPSAVPGFCGLPTNDTRSQVVLEWRNMELLNLPYIFDYTAGAVRAVTAADLTQFDYAFLCVNGARVLNIPFIFNPTAGGTLQPDYNNVMTQSLYNWANWNSDANLFRPIYKSQTFYLNATAFNDTGMVTGNQFNPNILFSGTLLSFSSEQPQNFYGFVVDNVKNGRYSARPLKGLDRQFIENWEVFPHYHRMELLRLTNSNPTDVLNLDPNTTIQVINLGTVGANTSFPSPVPNNSQILSNSLRSLGCKAKEGMFTVQRLNTVSPAWQSATNTSRGGTVTDPYIGLYQCYQYTIDNTGLGHFVPFIDNCPIGTTSANLPILYDTLWSKDMTFSWVRFSGLSLNSQTSVSTQLLIRKVYSGYEVQPTVTSSWSGMMKLAPKPDLLTMQALMDAYYELKDAMPARYNFWGALGSIAAQGLATFGSSLLENIMNPKKQKPQRSPKAAATMQMENPSGRPPRQRPSSQPRPSRNRSRSGNQPRRRSAPPSRGRNQRRQVDTNKQIHNLERKIDNMNIGRKPRGKPNRGSTITTKDGHKVFIAPVD